MRGMSKIEVLAGILFGSIVAAVGIPTTTQLVAGDLLRNSGTDLIASMLYARGEAIKRNAPVALEPQGSWDRGWIVATVSTGETLASKPALAGRVHINAAPSNIVFSADGHLLATKALKFEIADKKDRSSVRCVTTETTGLPRLTVGSCS